MEKTQELEETLRGLQSKSASAAETLATKEDAIQSLAKKLERSQASLKKQKADFEYKLDLQQQRLAGRRQASSCSCVVNQQRMYVAVA